MSGLYSGLYDNYTTDDFLNEGKQLEEKQKASEPGFVDIGLSAVRTSLTGGSTFLNMVENKRMMPANEGEDDYHTSEEFKSIVDKAVPNISLSDFNELKEAKNADYLQLKIENQKKHREAIDTIEKAGLTGAAVETVMSFADVPSWLVGGAVFKAGTTMKTAMNLQKAGANTIANMAIGSTAASSAIYASEKAIQTEAGVDMDERANTMAQYGAMFGMALPLLGQTFTTVASGTGRQSIASTTNTLINNIPGTGSLRGFFSISSADQLVTQGTSDLAREIGNLATTRVNASKDANGNFVTASDDTAMDYTQTVIEREVTNLHYGAFENSKQSGLDMKEQSYEDGKSWNDFTNSVEQTIRRDVGNMSKEDLYATYKEATGVEELPFERVQAKYTKQADSLVEQATALAEREKGVIETQVQSIVKDLSVGKREANIKQRSKELNELTPKVKTAESKLTTLQQERQTLQSELDALIAKRSPYAVVKKDNTRVKQLEKKISSLDTKLVKAEENFITSRNKLEEVKTRSIEPTQDDLVLFDKKARTNTETSIKNINRRLEKTIKQADEIRNQKLADDLFPEDLYDVVTAHKRSKGFDDGIFVAPAHLSYIQDFYSKFGEDATKYELKGIAGKDSRGYGHVKYNPDEIMSNVPLAEQRFKEMLMDDELNKALIRNGELTEEEIEQIAKKMVENALDRDFVNRYLDGGRGAQSTSATKRRKLRMNRSLYPEYFVNDINVIGTEYADRIGGKIAMKKVYGMDTDNLGRMTTVIDEKLKEIVEAGRANGASERAIKKDVENARAIFETVLGSRKYNKDPDKAINKVSRMLRKGSSALYSAGFVKYAIVEPTVAILRYGLKPVIDNFVPSIKGVQNQIKNSDPSSPLVKVMRQAGLAIQMQRGLKYDRYDNMEVTPTTGKTEMFLDKMSHYSRKFSGFNYVNDVSDFVAGGGALSELQTIMSRPTNMTKQEASRMARYGLSSDDITNINRQNIIKSEDGQITDWNFEEWKDQDLAKKFVRYIGRATRDTVMRADGTRVHRWQSDVNNPLAAMGLQFTQMPTALYERLLLNLGDEASARTVVGIITAVGTMYSILKLEDMALVQSGVNEDYEDDTKLLVKAVTRTPMAGIVPNFIDTGLMLTGNAPLGSAFAPRTDLASMFLGAGYSTGNKILKTGMGLADGVSGTDLSNGLKITPIINAFPILNVGIKSLEKELKEEGKLQTTTPLSFDKPLFEQIGD